MYIYIFFMEQSIKLLYFTYEIIIRHIDNLFRRYTTVLKKSGVVTRIGECLASFNFYIFRSRFYGHTHTHGY